MRCTAARLALLLALGAPAGAEEIPDERHPRVPDEPLAVTFAPYYCPACVAESLLEAEPREVTVMRKGVSRLVADLGLRGGWFVIESPTFRVFSTLRGFAVKSVDSTFNAADLQRLKEVFPRFRPGPQGAYLTPHQRAHLYQIRLERLCCHFRALTGNDLANLGMGGRFEVFLFEEVDDYRAFTEGSLGRAFDPRNTVQRKHLAGEDNFYAFATAAARFKGGDREMNNVVAHHAGHMLVNGHLDFLSDVWAWLEEGMAHFYERRESNRHNYFCMQGQEPPPAFVRGNWEKTIRLMVYRKREPSFGAWCEKLHPQELSGEEHALAWSLVDWLVRTDPIRLAKLLDIAAAKERPGASDAVQQVFGITPYALHERWAAWVLATYGS